MDYVSEKPISGWHLFTLNDRRVYIPPAEFGSLYKDQIIKELMSLQIPEGAKVGKDGVVYAKNRQPHRGKGGHKTPIFGHISMNFIMKEMQKIGYEFSTSD